MVSGCLHLLKNDSSGDQIRDAQRWVFSHCWSFQDLEALLRGLLAWSFCAYRLQQPPLVHEYEEFELQANLLGSRTLSLPLPNRLLSEQSQWSCWRLISIPSAKCRGKRDPPRRERQNLAPFAIFANQCQFLKPQHPSQAIAILPSAHLQHARLTSTALILGYVPSWIG